MKFISYLFLSLTVFLSNPLFSQEILLDKVIGKVGSESILLSEMQSLSQSTSGKASDCQLIQSLVSQKAMVQMAKSDTLISVSQEEVNQSALAQLSQYKAQYPLEVLFKEFGVDNETDLLNLFKPMAEDGIYVQRKQYALAKDVDISPSEVRSLYMENLAEMSQAMIPEQISYARLQLEAKPTQEDINELYGVMGQIKQSLIQGADFGTLARKYSIDPSAQQNGGFLGKVERGQMVKPFENAVFSLKEGEYSQPIKTDFGYHLIYINKVDASGVYASHILLKPVVSKDKLNELKVQMEQIKKEIDSGSITFEEAVKKYSTDLTTKNNKGIVFNPETGSDNFERSTLPMDMKFSLAGLKEGEISDLVVVGNQVEVRKLVKIIPEHNISLESNYDLLKNYALNLKKDRFVKEKLAEYLGALDLKLPAELQSCVKTN
ncbi:MAG: hypothetical protein C4K58_03030 [Flavobacteriaceae bacterium]|nr:MAG: hypothetical protein C4K58_03030 [Flavobacteriaceae bacterium]